MFFISQTKKCKCKCKCYACIEHNAVSVNVRLMTCFMNFKEKIAISLFYMLLYNIIKANKFLMYLTICNDLSLPPVITLIL